MPPNHFNQEDRDRILRLEERVSQIQKTLENVDETLKYIQEDLRKHYVSKAEFGPISKAVITGITMVITTLVSIAVTFIFRK